MTISKLTNNVKSLDEQNKINEIIDALGTATVAIDNQSITENSSDEIQTVGVIDSRSGSAIKTWTGTKSQYDSILTKDSTTLYNITDDTDVTLTLLEALYPVGSIYIGTMANCPLATLGVGTWTLKTSRVLVDKYSSGSDWWELYSDGWCRQGSTTVASSDNNSFTVDLLKTMANTNYSILFTRESDAIGTDYVAYITDVTVKTNSMSTTSFQINRGYNSPVHWMVEGYTSTTTNHKQWERTA